jgi:hypothetical protein
MMHFSRGESGSGRIVCAAVGNRRHPRHLYEHGDVIVRQPSRFDRAAAGSASIRAKILDGRS